MRSRPSGASTSIVVLQALALRADCLAMRAAVAFADVLDEVLEGFRPIARSADRWTRPAYVPPHPFLYSTPTASRRFAAYRTETVAGGPVRRELSARERAALDALVAFGSTLSTTFTAAELRGAFRTLARRYHPDRHPGAGTQHQAQLARTFAEIVTHYRVLAAIAH